MSPVFHFAPPGLRGDFRKHLSASSVSSANWAPGTAAQVGIARTFARPKQKMGHPIHRPPEKPEQKQETSGKIQLAQRFAARGSGKRLPVALRALLPPSFPAKKIFDSRCETRLPFSRHLRRDEHYHYRRHRHDSLSTVGPPSPRFRPSTAPFCRRGAQAKEDLGRGPPISMLRFGVVTDRRRFRRPIDWGRSHYDHQCHWANARLPKRPARPRMGAERWALRLIGPHIPATTAQLYATVH